MPAVSRHTVVRVVRVPVVRALVVDVVPWACGESPSFSRSQAIVLAWQGSLRAAEHNGCEAVGRSARIRWPAG